MSFDLVALAERITGIASDTQSVFSDDTTLLACWVEQDSIFIVFRSNLMQNKRRALGIVCDSKSLTDTDAYDLAYDIYQYEMVEPHPYQTNYSHEHDAIDWRFIGSWKMPARLDGLLAAVATERSIGEHMRRASAAGVAIVVYFAAPFLSGRAGPTSHGSTAYGSSSLRSESESGTKTVYTYESSKVEASVDGASINLKPFAFSTGTVSASVPLLTAGNGCQPVNADHSGKFLVARRGDCTFELKYEVAQRGGASGLVITSSEPLTDGRWQNPRIDLTDIPVLVSDEPKSTRMLADGRTISVSFQAWIDSQPSG